MAPPLRVRRLAGRFFWMIEHQRPLLPQSSFVIRRSPMVGNMAQQSHSSCVGKYGSNPDFVLGGRTSASAECRHWSARAAIDLPDGRKLLMLRDATAYTALPKAEQDTEEWQTAMET